MQQERGSGSFNSNRSLAITRSSSASGSNVIVAPPTADVQAIVDELRADIAACRSVLQHIRNNTMATAPN